MSSGKTQTDDARRKAGRRAVRVWLTADEADALDRIMAAGAHATIRDVVGESILRTWRQAALAEHEAKAASAVLLNERRDDEQRV